jgi:uncharacterized membrane protein
MMMDEDYIRPRPPSAQPAGWAPGGLGPDQRPDPVLAGFDHILALAGYALLFVSVLMGLPALVALVIAWVHRHDTHALVRSHYRFQIRIVWVAALLLAVALVAGLVGAAGAFGQLLHLIQSQFGHTVVSATDAMLSGWVSGGLLVVALAFWGVAFGWTLLASVYGFVRLMAERPIGPLAAD